MTPGGPLLSVADLGLHRQSVEGTTRARDLPLNSVIRQAFSVEGLARRNQGATALLRLREQSPELQRLLRPYEEGVPLRADEATLSAYVDGVQQRFVGPKAVVEGLSRFAGDSRGEGRGRRGGGDDDRADPPLRRRRPPALNALFIPTNVIRDAWTFLVRTGARSDPQKLGAAWAPSAEAYWDSFAKGAVRPRPGRSSCAPGAGRPTSCSTRPRRRSCAACSGAGAGGALGPIRSRVRPVTTREGFMRAVGDVAGAGWDVARLPLAPVKAFGSAVERAPRLAQYRLSRAAGESPRRAALAGRDITMDFSRGGTFSKVVNRIVPFFNVGLQSPERLAHPGPGQGQPAPDGDRAHHQRRSSPPWRRRPGTAPSTPRTTPTSPSTSRTPGWC